MTWTYRICRDTKGRYSVRELFHERDGTLITYSKEPVAPIGSSPEDLLKQMQWFREAFDLSILSTEDLDRELAQQPARPKPQTGKNISLKQLKAELALEPETA